METKSIRAFLKKAREQAAEAVAPPPPVPPLIPKPQKPAVKANPAEIVGSEKVKAACGHEVELFLHAVEMHLPARRKKISDRACTACRQEKQKAQEAVAAERKVNQVSAPKPPKKFSMPFGDKGRLPHGSQFHGTYDAKEERWFGWLQVPPHEGRPGVELKTDTGGILNLPKKLDNMYRAWLAENSFDEKPATPI